MTRRTTPYLGLAAALACAALSGCGKMTVVDIAADLAPGSRSRLATQLFDGRTADARRDAVLIMSFRRWWGLEPTALRAYALIARTASEEPTVRSVALRALGRAGTDAMPHADEILSALGDRISPHVRWDAAIALDEVRTGGDRPFLSKIILAMTTKPREAPSTEALDAQRDEWSDKVVPHLMAHLKWGRDRRTGEPSLDVRVACARALRIYRRTEVVVVLAAAMENDEDYAVRREAHESLVELVGYDRGWAQSDWEDDMVKLPSSPSGAGKRWWDPLGLFASGGGAHGAPGDS